MMNFFRTTFSLLAHRRLLSTRTSPLQRQSTTNPDEIAHFSRLSQSWWDERGEFMLLHRMNPVRVEFIRDKLMETARDDGKDSQDQGNSPLNGKAVLDVGCGGGLLSESLARLGAHPLGIDASPSNIAVAEHHAAMDGSLGAGLSYRHTTAETLLEAGHQFDVVCAMEILEHVDNPAMFLRTCAALVKPGGHFFLSTISRTPLAYLLTVVLAEHVLHLVSKGTHTYSKFVKPSELVDFFRSYASSPPAPILSEVRPRAWISSTSVNPSACARTEAEVRGIVYEPWSGQWRLVPRYHSSTAGQSGLGELCNYLFWVRRPPLDDALRESTSPSLH